MKVNKRDLEWFLQNIRRKLNGEECTDKQLISELAKFMETNPSCINMDGVSNKGRYYYSPVGYGVFSLLGEFYRMGRIEVFDKKDNSGYAVHEGTFCMPFVASNQFECFMETLQTNFPIQINIGSVDWCANEVAKKLKIDKDKLNDPEVRKKYYAKKYKKDENIFNKLNEENNDKTI